MNNWQDIVLAVSILAFNIALIPTVLGKSKPALSTCVITLAFLLAVVTVYVSLALWYSAVMSFINASLWAVIGVQKLIIIKASKNVGASKPRH